MGPQLPRVMWFVKRLPLVDRRSRTSATGAIGSFRNRREPRADRGVACGRRSAGTALRLSPSFTPSRPEQMRWISDLQAQAVAEALRLRAWALDVLCSPAPAGPPPAAGAAAWDVFLRTERCALALSAGQRALGGEAGGVLRSRTYVELKRVLSARGEMAKLGGLARTRGWTVAVLKGGAAVAAGENVDLIDVDVLAAPEEADTVSEALGELGYGALAGRGAHRVGVRAARTSIHIEIHTAVPGLDEDGNAHARRRLEPSPIAGLGQLPAPEHLWYVLHHSAEQHPDRRGRLRELLVIAQAIRRCTPAELAGAERRVAAHPRAALLRMQLDMARAVAARQGAPRDAFRLTAAGNYLVDRWVRSWPGPAWLRAWSERAAVAAVARREGYPSEIGNAALGLPSRHGALRWLHAHVPAAERVARVASRRGPEWSLAPVGERVASAAQRFAEAAPDGR